MVFRVTILLLEQGVFLDCKSQRKECEGWRQAAYMSGSNNVFPKKFHAVSFINTCVVRVGLLS